MLTLTEFSDRYVRARRVSAAYGANIRRRAAAIERHAHQRDIDRVLSEPVVNEFLASLDRSPFTIRSYRSDLLALWNAAADADLVPYPVARRIPCPHVPELLIECYTLGEARGILAAARDASGVYPNGVPKRLYWPAVIQLAWDSGLRRGDVWLFRRDAVRPDGSLRLVQHKTGRALSVRLRPATLAALKAIDRPLPCAWSLDPSFFGRHFKRLIAAAGVNRGTFKWLRRASGSYVEAAFPGSGHRHLGHSQRVVFDRFYDAHLDGDAAHMPPALD